MTTPYLGVYRALVTQGAEGDPSGLGRVKVSLPALLSPGVEPWALVLRPVGAEPVGPAAGDTVLLAFEGGELDYPVVLGLLPASDVRRRKGVVTLPRQAFGKTRIR